LKLNILGVVSAILAFISLALPWWVLTVEGLGTVSFYPWGVTGGWAAMAGYALAIYSALILIVISGVLGLIGSAKIGGRGRTFVLVAGILAILSVVIFAGGLQSFVASVFIKVKSLFYSGPYNGGYTASAYLSFGFWLALVAAIIAFVAYLKYPKVT